MRRNLFLSIIREQILRPTPNTLLSSFVEIHGSPSVALDTLWSANILTVALLNEALKVSSCPHLCFFRSQTVLRCTAIACGPDPTPAEIQSDDGEHRRECVFVFEEMCSA